MIKRRIIIFCHWPLKIFHETKTQRLKASEQITDLPREMILHTLRTAKSAAYLESAGLDLKLDDDDNNEIFQKMIRDEDTIGSKQVQNPSEQIMDAFRSSFRQGTNQVILIKTNCPSLSVYHIRKAFKLLKNNDVVLGPTKNSDFYLLGFKRLIPELLDVIPGISKNIYASVLEEAKKLGLTTAELGFLPDITRAEDLSSWKNVQQQTVSVIIPTRNNEKTINNTLERVMALDRDEVIVVDGMSSDKTVEYARQGGAEILSSNPKKSTQMNLGAEQAKGNILLFLSPNELAPVNYKDHIRQVLSVPEYLGGYFSLRFKSRSLISRTKEKIIGLWNILKGLSINKQAVFVRASVFHELNGFSETADKEIVEFMRRLNKAGSIIRLRVPVFIDRD